jgi:hypothetical protein
MRVSKISPTGDVEVLPMQWSFQNWETFVVSPNEDALYVGTDEGKILVHYAPWTDGPSATLLKGLGRVSQLKACTEG